MRWVKALVLMGIGGAIYAVIELIWRRHTHWTMALLGGLLFVLIGAINEYIPWCIPLWRQGVIGALIVTWAELVAGLVLNVWLRLGIWDYSNLPGNFIELVNDTKFNSLTITSASGLILPSGTGKKFSITVDDTGAVTTTEVT